ncbi:Endonuclease/exonuclease/phosphatase [Neolentinus lepideus HHB14362 ss-1]|uniref:Endonuclease/exonuclease/phosphatase n=1 Tax=Neolentinus lepideus HHB14362 ss-1 TaxID=1314782 RepID=A0A165W0T0_9AGAM|nr:Endonuclease/exonuclease/phosphatase [Neolentinus lepideus HHB14362 ss-1]
MSNKGAYQLTPEQLARQEERKRKKQKAQSQPKKTQLIDEEKGRTIPRTWFKLQETDSGSAEQRIKIMTWNLLAQCLVRRELFPNSDCLKAPQREHMIYLEIASRNADIVCLQEVDRLEKLFPVLESIGYSHTYAAGPRKLHGSLIAYKKNLFEKVAEKVVFYDDEDIRQNDNERARRGSSFHTKNIANVVALKAVGSEQQGLVVATTHLFWHPKYTYERARQAGILRREVIWFQKNNGYDDWPCIVAGDFNAPPDDATYALLVGDPILPSQEERLSFSRVVHTTIDPSVAVDVPKTLADDGEGATVQTSEQGEDEPDPDRMITNARRAAPKDGLLTTAELLDLYSAHDGRRLKSLYDDGFRLAKAQSNGEKIRVFGDRFSCSEAEGGHRLGMHEPEWTSYTHYWQATLDYIFVMDPPNQISTVFGLLSPLQTEDLKPGLPRLGISGSDHVSLVAEVAWSKRSDEPQASV